MEAFGDALRAGQEGCDVGVDLFGREVVGKVREPEHQCHRAIRAEHRYRQLREPMGSGFLALGQEVLLQAAERPNLS